jgi:hypothetical protein
VAVGAITKGDFEYICGHAIDDSHRFLTEDGWLMDETESFLGVVVIDKTDQDWGYVILARDEYFVFRAIETGASFTDREVARRELQFAIGKLVGESQGIFPQGQLDQG